LSETPTSLPAAARLRIFAYLGVLIVLLGFGSPHGGLIDTPVTFFLKNRLHLTAQQTTLFRLLAATPLFFAFVFGFVRDTFNPLGRRDRGFFILFGAVTAAVYACFAFVPIGPVTLVAGVILANASFLFVWSAQNGLTSALGQQHVMSGRIAAAWNVFHYAPVVTAYFLGGLLSQSLEGQQAPIAARVLFLVGAAIMAAVAAFGFWRPQAVYGNLAERPPAASRWSDIQRLMRHWPIWPALAIWLLWSFAPGSSTPLAYFMQNRLHATDAQWGEWNALFLGGLIPTFLLFGWLCQRVALRTILLWATLAAIPQFVPMAFIHSVPQALAAAVVIGLLGGCASAAYLDLVIRCTPPGLQGTVMMLYWALFYVADRFGDVLGGALYERFHNFDACVVAITVVYALILPILWLVPRRLTATKDGEVPV
jgi:hypothetical protein